MKGEPSIVAVREALAKYRGGMITLEQPPKGEHQANGVVEETGRTIRDMARVLKVQLEHKVLVDQLVLKVLLVMQQQVLRVLLVLRVLQEIQVLKVPLDLLDRLVFHQVLY